MTQDDKEYVKYMINKSIRQFCLGCLTGLSIIIVICGIVMILTK